MSKTNMQHRKVKLILKRMEQIYRVCENEIRILEKEAKALPESHLMIKKIGEQLACYEKIGTKEKSIMKDSVLAKKLARKQILEADVKDMRFCHRTLRDALKNLVRYLNEQQKARGNITLDRIPEMFEDMFCAMNLSERKALSLFKNANTLYPESRIYETLRGSKVRSKSEQTIADTLVEYGIMFFYELRINIGGQTFVPDFVIIRADGTIIIWEHFGLMDQEDYRNDALKKIDFYASIGFRQHTNLICTNESDMLSKKTICKIIEERLL